MKYVSKNLEETHKIAEDFLDSISPKENSAYVVGLYGDLGSGKTTFTKSVATLLGVEDSITSPTFVIEKIYELSHQAFTHLIHIDAYRLESGDELVSLGWKKIIEDKHNLILIEWPEKVSKIMPEHTRIKFRTLSEDNAREIEIES